MKTTANTLYKYVASVATTLFLPALMQVNGYMCSAQKITFDTDDYHSVTVYDSWENSPFRTGKLAGNALVVNNHLNQVVETLGYAPNATPRMAGFQCSHYAGNLFGLRVDLKQPFRLTKTERYVHVMINRPVDSGRVMLITLGKRSERAGQSADVEQTWSLSSTSVGKDGWYDAVFAIKGFSYDDPNKNGIDIYSLVICPDIADRSAGEDFLCYVDEIEINNSPVARFSIESYPVSFDKQAKVTRTDRFLSSVGISGGKDGAQSCTGLNTYFYNDRTSTLFHAKAGERLTPSIGYSGTWMDGFVYIDWGNDGSFNTALTSNGRPAEGSDVVSYNASQINGTWYKSDGSTVANGNQIANGIPAFTIPASTPHGFYRMRYKVDWSSIDPAGNTNSDNLITNNGGGITDVMLNVHGDEVSVTASQLNGDIYPANELTTPLQDYKVPYGQPLTIKVVPAPGFTYTGIRVRYGYNLTGDSLIHDNPQYFDCYFPYNQFVKDVITLPASIFCADHVEIEGYMIDEKNLVLTDEPVSPSGADKIVLQGTRTRTMELEDNTHSLIDLTSQTPVPVKLGNSLSTDPVGKLFIDYNRDGKYNLVTEDATDGVLSTATPGVYKAVLVSGTYQYLVLVNVHPETVALKVNSNNGRIIGRQTYPTAETMSSSTGIPVGVAPYKFCGLVAQPLCEGYTCTSATIRHGYNLDGEDVVDGIRQWSEYTIDIPQEGNTAGRINLPIDSVCGHIMVTANFIPTPTATLLPSLTEEFDGPAINTNLWTTSPRQSAAWNRFISSDPRVAYIENGALVCRAIANDNRATDNVEMLTGAKETRRLYSFNHGYIEVRAKTTPHSGNFPAIWLMPDDQHDGWPVCGEIDIWETINNENRSYHTVHSNWTYNLNKGGNGGNAAYTMDGEWHTYGLLKEASKLTWYVDGNQVFTYTKSTDAEALSQGQWPFDKAFYIILNQSVGNGSWAAGPDKNFCYETCFDWCRVYQLPEDIPGGDGINAVVQPVNTGNTDATFDLQGRRVDATHSSSTLPSGIYIMNGKKVILK